jgi:acetyl-CoA carboxylase carboxyl transferase subunit alpha
LLALKVIDAIVPEPMGGAHRAPKEAIGAVADQIAAGLQEIDGMSGEALLQQRRKKFLDMGRSL